MLQVFMYFFFNHTATPEIYPLSLHDALPISSLAEIRAAYRRLIRAHHPDLLAARGLPADRVRQAGRGRPAGDRKSTRLNSSHVEISYAVFCLKKKKSYMLSHSPKTAASVQYV